MTGDDNEGQRPPRPPRRGLTAEELKALLAWLDPDPDKAGEEYVKLFDQLARYFDWKGCRHPAEQVDETFNRVARRILADGPPAVEDPYSFCHGFASLILKEYWRRIEREQQHLEKEPPTPSPDPEPEDEDRQRARLAALGDCLRRLPVEDQELLRRYYEYEGEGRIRHRRQLAQKRGTTLNALRIQAHRVRRKVITCLKGARQAGGNVFPPRDI